MSRPFTLQKCENRNQIIKQYERCLDALAGAGIHLQTIANSYGEGYEQYRNQVEAVADALYAVYEMVESAKASS